MPVRSQAQRAFLNARYGHAWVKKHHFDQKGKLPEHAPKRKGKKQSRASIKRDGMIRNFQKKHGGGGGRGRS
jgi:hypothetical protein